MNYDFNIWILLVAIAYGIGRLIRQNHEILKSKKHQYDQDESQDDHADHITPSETNKRRFVFRTKKMKKNK